MTPRFDDPLSWAGLLLAGWACARAWAVLSGVAAAGAGYKAKVLASAVFVSGRDARGVLAEDVALDSYRVLRLFRAKFSADAVSVRFLGLFPARTALFRPGPGAALAWGRPPRLCAVRAPSDRPSPAAPSGADERRLDSAVAAAFEEPSRRRLRRTRAVVVMRAGAVVAERYAPGFDARMPLCGWSMSKSVLAALVGRAAAMGILRPEDRRLLPQWLGPGDRRAEISVEDLLRMRSGLAFDETYANPLSDVTQMLFARPDAAAFAASRPLVHPPGSFWQYASGTSNILSAVLRRALERAGLDYHGFPQRELFGPAGMPGAVFETDAAGTFVGSSFVYAPARDWAAFGDLLRRGGLADGRRLLPEGWAAMAAAPTPQSEDGCYGAHWWLKLPQVFGGETAAARELPSDAFHALGHEGQCLSVIPSRKLVVVRLGLSIYIDAWDHAAFLARVLNALD
ncbi:MAG: serine hydrolase [Elusimicrobia bacterium]|nr:serine hydrolase [Elusimicrobiota bacterium]